MHSSTIEESTERELDWDDEDAELYYKLLRIGGWPHVGALAEVAEAELNFEKSDAKSDVFDADMTESSDDGPKEIVERVREEIQSLQSKEAGASKDSVLDGLDEFDDENIEYQLKLQCRKGVIYEPSKGKYRVFEGDLA